MSQLVQTMPFLQSPIMWLLIGYLCGSILFGPVLSKIFNLGDLRKVGSGNVGATNMLRTGNKGIAALTLLADTLKATIPVLLGLTISLHCGLAAGLGAFLGHLFPVWNKFKGGKGIASYLGVAIAFWWQGLAAFAITWLIVAWVSRYSSLAALCATLATPLGFFLAGQNIIASLFVIMGAIAWFKHRENIKRLIDGTESKIGGKSTS